MLSLSNYLTNRSETALISAYCSAWLNAASLGGLSGKPWYGAQQASQADEGEQQPCAVRSQGPQRHIRQSERPPSGVVRLVMALLNASLHLCLIHGGENYWIANSQRLDKKNPFQTQHFSSLVALFCGVAAKNDLCNGVEWKKTRPGSVFTALANIIIIKCYCMDVGTWGHPWPGSAQVTQVF